MKVYMRNELAREGDALEEEALVAHPRARPGGWCATAKLRRGGSLVRWKCRGLGSTTGGSMSTGSGAGWRAGSCRRTCVPRRKSRRCCWCGSICAGCRRGPPSSARDAARGGRCGILSATNIGRLRAGSMRYAWKSSSSFASAAWLDARRVRVGEGGAIRCRSQTELDTPSGEYLVQRQRRTRPTAASANRAANRDTACNQ
jgi:hypothetical protein